MAGFPPITKEQADLMKGLRDDARGHYANGRTFSRDDILQAFARVYCRPPWTKLVLDASFGMALVEELGL